MTDGSSEQLSWDLSLHKIHASLLTRVNEDSHQLLANVPQALHADEDCTAIACSAKTVSVFWSQALCCCLAGLDFPAEVSADQWLVTGSVQWQLQRWHGHKDAVGICCEQENSLWGSE